MFGVQNELSDSRSRSQIAILDFWLEIGLNHFSFFSIESLRYQNRNKKDMQVFLIWIFKIFDEFLGRSIKSRITRWQITDGSLAFRGKNFQKCRFLSYQSFLISFINSLCLGIVPMVTSSKCKTWSSRKRYVSSKYPSFTNSEFRIELNFFSEEAIKAAEIAFLKTKARILKESKDR